MEDEEIEDDELQEDNSMLAKFIRKYDGKRIELDNDGDISDLVVYRDGKKAVIAVFQGEEDLLIQCALNHNKIVELLSVVGDCHNSMMWE